VSRSRKKTPIHGHTHAPSDKPWKVMRHRKERRTTNERLHMLQLGEVDLEDDSVTALERETYRHDDWDTPKDGKSYYDHPSTYRK